MDNPVKFMIKGKEVSEEVFLEYHKQKYKRIYETLAEFESKIRDSEEEISMGYVKSKLRHILEYDT